MASLVEIIIKTIDQGGTKGTNDLTASLTKLAAQYLSVSAVAGGAYKIIKDSVNNTLQYANSVRQLSQVSGQSAEETSRFVQVLDDYKIGANDALVATRALTKNGLSPSIDTLAKLSDQYLSLNSAEERNTFVLNNLGRSGLQWVEVLNKGSDAIRKQGDAVADGLILNQKALDDARKMEIAQDNLGEAWEQLSFSIGKKAIPALTQGIDEFNNTTRAIEIMKEAGMSGSEIFRAMAVNSDKYTDALKQAGDENTAARDAMLETADAAQTQGGAFQDAAAQAEELKKQMQEMSDENKSFLSTLNDVSGNLHDYKEGLAEADAALAAGDITIEEHGAKVAELAAQYEDASKRIVLSLLEMKYTADGTFDDTELSKYLIAAEKLGVITEEDRQATMALYQEVDTLDASLVNVGKDTNTTANKLVNMDGRLIDATASAANMKEELVNADGVMRGAAGGAGSLAVQLGRMPPDGTEWNYLFNIVTNGKVPKLPRGTYSGAGAGYINNAGVDQQWTGGQMGNGWTIVGDAPGGSWTPYTEVITPSGYVFNAREALKLKQAGALMGAKSRAYGTQDISGGYSDFAIEQYQAAAHPRSNHGGSDVTASVRKSASEGTTASAPLAASSSVMASSSVSAQAFTSGVVSTVTHGQQASISVTNRSNKLLEELNTNLKKLIGLTPTAPALAKANQAGASKYS